MSNTAEVFTQTCVCGRTFTGLNSFTQHEKGYAKGKKHLAGALSRAREAYWNKKARIQESTASNQAADQLVESTSANLQFVWNDLLWLMCLESDI